MRSSTSRAGGAASSDSPAAVPGSVAARRAGCRPRPRPPADQHQALAALRVLVGQLLGDPATERVTDDGDALDVEHAQQVAHPVGVTANRVVTPGLVRQAVPEQIGHDHSMGAGEPREDGSPGLGLVADAVQEQQRRSLPADEEGPVVAVHDAALPGEPRPIRRRLPTGVGTLPHATGRYDRPVTTV